MITADGVPTAEMDYVALNVILNQAWATGEIGWDLGSLTQVFVPTLDQLLLEQGNTERQRETNVNCIHAQLG